MARKILMVWVAGAVAATVFGAGDPAAGALVLTSNGKSAATIVVAADATRAAQFAAFELQHHLNLITGGDFPIVADVAPTAGVGILVGDSRAAREAGVVPASYGIQEYEVRVLPRAILLAGRDKEDRGRVAYDHLKDPKAVDSWPDFWDEQGTVHAVYDFLERFCGVRWLNPTATGTVCPANPDLAVQGTDIRRAPRFRYRNACYRDSSGYDAFVSLWPRGSDGFNAWEAAAYAGAHASGNYPAAKFGGVQLFRLRRREGGEKSDCNHSLYGYYDRFWDAGSTPSQAKAFVARQPDWFAKGYPAGTKPPQMCYTSTGLIAQVARDAKDYFDGAGESIGLRPFQWGENFFAVEPMDNASFCQCATCQEQIARPHSKANVPFYSKGTHSEYFFSFVNEVAKRVRQTNPDKTVSTLAYMTHAWPPESFRLEPSVAVQFCFAGNRTQYARGGYENDLAALKAWADESRESGRPLYLWLYYCFPVEVAQNGKFNCFPGFFAHTIGEQFRLFDRYGIRGFFHCGYGQDVEAYVTYKLMDDPTLDVDTLLDEYFAGLYGPAAKPLRDFYSLVEETYRDPKNYPERFEAHQSKLVAWEHLGTEDRMRRLGAMIEEAQAVVANSGTSAQRTNVELFDKAIWSYMVAGRNQYLEHKHAPIPALTAARLPAAGGDPRKVDWSRASDLCDPRLPGHWYDRGGAQPSARTLAGRIAHDGAYLYLELVDPCTTAKLTASPKTFPYDTWEIYVGKQRALPYRQYALGPTGETVALSHGEVAWRMDVAVDDKGGMRVVSDASASDRWRCAIAFPLDRIAPGGVKPGETLFLNVMRVSSPSITGAGIGVDTWVSFCSVHDVDRLAEVTLAP
jgi:hypothetical protein